MSTRYVIICQDCEVEADDGPYRRESLPGVRRVLRERGWRCSGRLDLCPECVEFRADTPASR